MSGVTDRAEGWAENRMAPATPRTHDRLSGWPTGWGRSRRVGRSPLMRKQLVDSRLRMVFHPHQDIGDTTEDQPHSPRSFGLESRAQRCSLRVHLLRRRGSACDLRLPVAARARTSCCRAGLAGPREISAVPATDQNVYWMAWPSGPLGGCRGFCCLSQSAMRSTAAALCAAARPERPAPNTRVGQFQPSTSL